MVLVICCLLQLSAIQKKYLAVSISHHLRRPTSPNILELSWKLLAICPIIAT